MEQIDTHISDQGGTLQELCQNIYHRAETVYLKLTKNEKTLLIITVVFSIAMLVLGWCYKRFDGFWHRSLILLGTLVVYVFVVYSVNKFLINAMKRAANPKQLLRMAKCLKWWGKLYKAIGALIIFFAAVFVNGIEDETALLIVGSLLLLFGFLVAPVDSKYNDGLTELEHRLEE